MAGRSASLVFSMVFGVAYVVCFYFNWALFRFYPAYSQFSFAPLGPEAGPAILWYGWMGWAAGVAAVAALVVPRRVADEVPPGAVWGIGAAVLAVIAVYERTWFF